MRKSQFVLLKKINHRTAKTAKRTIIQKPKLSSLKTLTITCDNGKEFADYQKITEKLNAVVRISYSSREKGYIESFNGKMRDELLDGEIFYTLKESQELIEMWRK